MLMITAIKSSIPDLWPIYALSQYWRGFSPDFSQNYDKVEIRVLQLPGEM